MDVIIPVIHPNGDRKATLLPQLKETYRALQTAQTALKAGAPNGRNYYLTDGLLAKAQQQHWDRVAQIKTVMDSILAEVQAIETTYPTAR
jgi:hypothetical protein